jgi:hypothetical protein
MKEQINQVYKKFQSEKGLVARVIDFLDKDGYQIRLEVPNSGQSADLVAAKKNNILIIEAKVNNWKRALEQCKAHENIADFICIALGAKELSNNLIDEARKRGYGIIHCSGEVGTCKWMVEPQKNNNMWLAQRNHWEEFLKEVPVEN